MASRVGKRKAPASLEDFEKRQRIERPPSPPVEQTQETDDEDDEYRAEGGEFSEEEHIADTPVTPFSPGRKKFPSELKTIKCTYEGCTKTFNSPARLTSHLRTHTNERPYACTYEGCDKTYFEDKHLQQHIKGSHTKERSFPCDWEGCNKSFLTSTRLNRHRNTHTGQHVYRCTAYPPCNEPFRKHQTLQRHIRSVHLLLAPYPCIYVDPVTSAPCNAGFDGALEQPLPGFQDDQNDFSWELQRQALEGGAFWVGADIGSGDFGDTQDEWTQEEEEMRRLIG